jgi:tRNA (guanine-N7-)-methyltransferase
MSEEERPKRRIEREFGVPIAGEILPQEKWTSTAIKRLPTGPIDFAAIFGRTAPVVIDLGCGNGRYLLSSAVWRPDHDHLGCDVLPVVIRYATRRGNQRGLTNVRFVVIDAQSLLREHIREQSVQELHLYHPQPYYDASSIERRLVTPAFLADCHRCLAADGLLYLQTDHGAYWRYIRETVTAFFELEERLAPWPDAPKGRTRREIIALRAGFDVFRAVCRPRRGIDAQEAQKIAESMPLPIFAADPALRRLDELE